MNWIQFFNLPKYSKKNPNERSFSLNFSKLQFRIVEQIVDSLSNQLEFKILLYCNVLKPKSRDIHRKFKTENRKIEENPENNLASLFSIKGDLPRDEIYYKKQ